MPLAKISSAASRISSLVTVLLMTRRSRSEPVSGAIVIERSPLSRSIRTIGGGEIVEPQRGRADRIAHVDQAAQDVIDVRMVAERDRHEAGARRSGGARRAASWRMRSVGNGRTGR